MASVLYQSGAQMPMEEVVPGAASVRGLTRSSILTQRRRIRIGAQTGRDVGTGVGGSTAAGGGNQQIQFLLSDAGGLVDPSSICLVYNWVTSTANVCPDDLSPFTRLQISLNGQLLDDIVAANKNANAEITLGATKDWYQTSGSFCGLELLNNELNTANASVATAAALQAYSSAWGDVSGNFAQIAGRYDDTADSRGVNPYGGEQRVLPLGLMSGVGRMKNYLPLSILGEMSFTYFTGSPAEVLFANNPSNSGDYCLKGVYLIADIVVPHPAYAEVLSRMANEDGAGISVPFESTVVAQGGVMSGNTGATNTTDYSIIVSRATNNLVRSLAWFQPQARLTSFGFPAQSCFGHHFVTRAQWRIGSQTYPQIPAEGDADLWAMSASAYGTAGLNEQNGVTNRILWSQTTPSTQPTGATTYLAAGGEGFAKFNFSDKCVLAYGFRTVKGAAEEVQMDGVSLAGASGSQAILAVSAAPYVDVAPFVSLVALRVIQAANGQVRVLGA